MKVSPSGTFPFTSTLGTVVKTAKELGVNAVGVYASRFFMGMDISAGASETNVKLDKKKLANSINKNIGKSSVEASNYIILPHRKLDNFSDPMYNLGERVVISMIDQDITTMAVEPAGFDDITRRRNDSKKIFVRSAENEDDPVKDGNSYYFLLDGINKMATIHLSDADGEVTKLDMTFDAGNGIFSVTDGTRSFGFGTDDDKVVMKNSASSISLEGGKIVITADDLEVMINNSTKFNSTTYKGEVQTFSEKISSYKGEIDSYTESGSMRDSQYEMSKTSGTKQENSYSIIVDKCDVHTITGFVCPGGVGFGAPEGMKPLFPNVQISPGGIMDMTGPTSRPMAHSDQVMAVLAHAASTIDTLCGILGVPAGVMGTYSSNAPMMPSTAVKG